MSIENKTSIEAETTRSARIVEVIETVSIRGNGADKPFREVVQYWDKDGVLIAERDPCNFIRKEY